ncbi:MAG: hypothetical protein ABWZ01_07195 [Methyloceanibacter sp.]
MPDLSPLHDDPPPELSALQAQLAMDEVIQEMANPAGLRMDEPVVDAVTAYKAHLREELSAHPQDLTTQFEAQKVMVEEFLVPPAETAEPVPEPEPVPPELLELQPAEASNQIPRIGVRFVGGPFNEFAEVVVDDVVQATTLLTESEVSAFIDCLDTEAASTRDCFVRQGEDETAHLPFNFTQAPAPPPAPEPENEVFSDSARLERT